VGGVYIIYLVVHGKLSIVFRG